MIFFLKLVAAAVVALLLIIGAVVLVARFYFKRLENIVSEFADLDLPEFRRKMRPCASVDWEAPDEAALLQGELEAEGFRVIGDFEEDTCCMLMRGFANPEKNALAMLIENGEEFGVELCRDYQDGSRISVSNLPSTLVSAATGAKIIHKPQASIADLAKLLLLEATVQDLTELAADLSSQDFASRYETVYAHRMNAVIDRGGPTIGEIRSHAIAQGETCDEEEATKIRAQWLRQISQFFSSKQLARFRQLSGDSDEHEHMMVAIHDRMHAEDLLMVLGEYDDFHFMFAAEDEDDKAALAVMNRSVAEMEARMEGTTPRQAFRDYLEATGKTKQYSFVQEVDKPIPGDIWRREDWDEDGYDDDLDDFTQN
jgi:hypothetical protein